MKKIFAISFLFLFLFSFIPAITHGAGLVPCGGTDEPACKFCHVFKMFNDIYIFVLKMVAGIAALMVIIGGLNLLLAGGRPAWIERGKNILTATAIGLMIIFGAWIIINTTFAAIGVSEWTGLSEGWFRVSDCP
jgi:hypothetical protein